MKKLQIIFYLPALIVLFLSLCNCEKQNDGDNNPDPNDTLSNSSDNLSPGWTQLADLEVKRGTHIMVAVKEKIYVAGGNGWGMDRRNS